MIWYHITAMKVLDIRYLFKKSWCEIVKFSYWKIPLSHLLNFKFLYLKKWTQFYRIFSLKANGQFKLNYITYFSNTFKQLYFSHMYCIFWLFSEVNYSSKIDDNVTHIFNNFLFIVNSLTRLKVNILKMRCSFYLPTLHQIFFLTNLISATWKTEALFNFLIFYRPTTK